MSRDVGNVRNKSQSLPNKVDPIDFETAKLSNADEKSKNLMAEWLSKGQKASNNMKKMKRNASENNDEENDPNDSSFSRKSAKKE